MKKFIEILKDYFKNIDIPENLIVENIQMDSKKIEKNSLFIAINNGNDYIDEAIEKGASLVISDRQVTDNKNFKIIQVKNSVEALQELAKRYRNSLTIKVIAITGSEGKTTTKDLIYSLLKQKFKTKKTLGNYNNLIGLPFSILQLKENDEIAVLELGMSNLGEIDKLSQIASPDYAVITNIGDSHLEYLENRDNVFKAKTEILKYVSSKNVFVYGDDFYFKNTSFHKIGFESKNDFKITNLEEKYEGTKFMLNSEEYFLKLNGKHNVINASFAIALAKEFKIPYVDIKKMLLDVEISNMRFEKIEKDKILYINDAYNASPVSVEMALNTFESLPTSREKIVVLGDVLEMGEKEIDYHIEILKIALSKKYLEIFIYGLRMKKAAESINSKRIKYFKDKKDIKQQLEKRKNIAVLLKGSRGMKLEEII